MSTNTEAKTYNGWKNYETWCVNLWLTNDQRDGDHWQEQADECWEEAKDRRQEYWTRSEAARYTLAGRLKEQLEESRPDLGASLWSDMLGAAFDEVDWDEIADGFLDECEDEEDDNQPAERYISVKP